MIDEVREQLGGSGERSLAQAQTVHETPSTVTDVPRQARIQGKTAWGTVRLMDEQRFKMEAERALHDLFKVLNAAADRLEIEPDFREGALTIEFDEPRAKFVVSPNGPVKQIWVSALTKSFKLDWAEDRKAFVLDGRDLKELMGWVIGQQLGEDVKL
jgi:CyaY protein